MKEQDQRGKNLPAIPDKIIVAPIANDASILAKSGFTERLPVAMKDLNFVLGRNPNPDTRSLQKEPAALSYTMETNKETPTFTRDVRYQSGPKVNLKVFPGEPVYIEGVEHSQSRAVLEINSGIGHDGSITSAFLSDLQDFVREIFPDKKATLYLKYVETVEGIPEEKEMVLDLHSLTEDQFNRLPRHKGWNQKNPYSVIIESRHADAVFLTTGIDVLWFYKGERMSDRGTGREWAIQKRTFNIYQLTYDSKAYGTSGADVEKLLERFRQFAAQNPYFYQTKEEAEEGLI